MNKSLFNEADGLPVYLSLGLSNVDVTVLSAACLLHSHSLLNSFAVAVCVCVCWLGTVQPNGRWQWKQKRK